ncbi:hypothetical protein HDV00_006312 [Rhizophlyctis rosea]|nr:hypothetical protein HDV00_006312 [Rhizophlyctis rosea]
MQIADATHSKGCDMPRDDSGRDRSERLDVAQFGVHHGQQQHPAQVNAPEPGAKVKVDVGTDAPVAIPERLPVPNFLHRQNTTTYQPSGSNCNNSTTVINAYPHATINLPAPLFNTPLRLSNDGWIGPGAAPSTAKGIEDQEKLRTDFPEIAEAVRGKGKERVTIEGIAAREEEQKQEGSLLTPSSHDSVGESQSVGMEVTKEGEVASEKSANQAVAADMKWYGGDEERSQDDAAEKRSATVGPSPEPDDLQALLPSTLLDRSASPAPATRDAVKAAAERDAAEDEADMPDVTTLEPSETVFIDLTADSDDDLQINSFTRKSGSNEIIYID